MPSSPSPLAAGSSRGRRRRGGRGWGSWWWRREATSLSVGPAGWHWLGGVTVGLSVGRAGQGLCRTRHQNSKQVCMKRTQAHPIPGAYTRAHSGSPIPGAYTCLLCGAHSGSPPVPGAHMWGSLRLTPRPGPLQGCSGGGV